MLLHESVHWKYGAAADLWLMEINYAMYNRTQINGFCPAVFFGSMVPRHHLKDLHIWRCPVFVLDPNLQHGQELSRWEPRSLQGMFVGLSFVHASDVPLALNLDSGTITAQFHVVFGDLFTTGSSIGWEDEQPPNHWEQLCLDNSFFTLVDSPPKFLQDDWLNVEENKLKYHTIQKQTKI